MLHRSLRKDGMQATAALRLAGVELKDCSKFMAARCRVCKYLMLLIGVDLALSFQEARI